MVSATPELRTVGTFTEIGLESQFSYTLFAGPEATVIQFRSIQSPLDLQVTALAKGIHGDLAATTQTYGQVGGDSSVLIYVIERLPEVPYITLNLDPER
ncbi:hypothetical protein AJ80_05615 [Polytolypa hystricis UAMH7299]|uniref:Uncharacterized protein n=1 Tax=Polytolypa hystricis (strain UAMH7299) TaxID=1447883 RepID=A0A2B7Y335_POLH7|nr:hypothetical protein AJ80_05615 [Polytolypa hystricis UAMH7299]